MSIYLPEIAASYNRQSSRTSYQRYSYPRSCRSGDNDGAPPTVYGVSRFAALFLADTRGGAHQRWRAVDATYIHTVVERARSVVASAVAGVTHPATTLAEWLVW